MQGTAWCALYALENYLDVPSGDRTPLIPLAWPRWDVVDGAATLRLDFWLTSVSHHKSMFVIQAAAALCFNHTESLDYDIRARLLAWMPSRRRLVQALMLLAGFLCAMCHSERNET